MSDTYVKKPATFVFDLYDYDGTEESAAAFIQAVSDGLTEPPVDPPEAGEPDQFFRWIYEDGVLYWRLYRYGLWGWFIDSVNNSPTPAPCALAVDPSLPAPRRANWFASREAFESQYALYEDVYVTPGS